MKLPAIKIRSRYNKVDWFLALSVAIAILWRPLVAWVLPFDAAGRVPFLLLGLSLVISVKRLWKTSFKYPLSLYCLLAVYLFLNGMLKRGYEVYEQDGIFLMFCAVFQSPLIMLLVASLAKKDFDCTVDWLLVTLFCYPLLSVLFGDIDIEGRLNGGINANELALVTVVFTALQLLKYLRGRCSLIFAAIMLVIPFYVIIRTGSRMGLVMVTAVILATILLKMRKRSKTSLILAALAFAALAIGLAYVLNNSILGERMAKISSQGEDSFLTTGTILDKFGDRGFQYFYSFPYFLEHPLTGIGLGNWINYSPNGLVCHSEYMVQYVENGLLAFIPYLVFFFTLIRRTRKSSKASDPISRSSAGLLYAMMLTIIFANSVLWSYNQYSVFVVYALCFVLSEDVLPPRKRRVRIVFGSKNKKRVQ